MITMMMTMTTTATTMTCYIVRDAYSYAHTSTWLEYFGTYFIYLPLGKALPATFAKAKTSSNL
jgi:hypothetical protein